MNQTFLGLLIILAGLAVSVFFCVEIGGVIGASLSFVSGFVGGWFGIGVMTGEYDV